MKKLIVPALTAVLICAFTLTLFAVNKGTENPTGEVRYSASASSNDPLLSVGAPRSQLELKRLFGSMSYTFLSGDGSKKVYEPISASFLSSGKTEKLSAEEILFIIADSETAYDKYDVIRLVERNGEYRDITNKKLIGNPDMPTHIAAGKRIADVFDIILYRVGTLCGEGEALEYAASAGVFTFDPESKKIFFSNSNAGGGKLLFPSDGLTLNTLRHVVTENDDPLSENEKKLLAEAGYDKTYCRNITPKYWYGLTDLRLAISGGKTLVVDTGAGKVTLCGGRLVSAALVVEGDADTVFFTAEDFGGILFAYSEGELTSEKLDDGGTLIVYEDPGNFGGEVAVRKAKSVSTSPYICDSVGEDEGVAHRK